MQPDDFRLKKPKYSKSIATGKEIFEGGELSP